MPDIGDYNGTMCAYWDGHQWIPAEVWEDEASRAARMIPPDPWWKRMLRTLGVGVAIVGILGALSATCYGLSQIPGCKSIPVSDAEVRQDARKLGKKALSCKNVKVYITGKWRDRAYVAVVGCKKKVMLNCRTRAGTCARRGLAAAL